MMGCWDGLDSFTVTRVTTHSVPERSRPPKRVSADTSPGDLPRSGRARGVQDTAARIPSESEIGGPAREPGVTPLFDPSWSLATMPTLDSGSLGTDQWFWTWFRSGFEEAGLK
jgi:hypothetical protein